MPQLIISAVGPDRPGIVGELTSNLHQAGANLLESRMINLRGEFAMMILLEANDVESLRNDLQKFSESIGIKLLIAPRQASAKSIEGLSYRLKTYSLDQPGIVARLTSLLRGHGVNIEELEAHQQSAAFAGDPIFLTEMRLTVPRNVPLKKLREELESLCNELNCDVDLEPG